MLAFWRNRARILLVVLTLWALAMIAPDFYRLVQPLGSLGFSVDGDGLVTDVRGHFADESESAAWQAGLRSGDRLDLAQMRCIPINTLRCATALASLGQLQLLDNGRRAELVVVATDATPARKVEFVAKTRPFTWWVAAILPFDQIAAICVILAAAWLVWTRPGKMTWGFFLYIIWFNPGQSYQYYALLQELPAALLAQHVAGGIAQGAGLAGFLLFALRVPRQQITPRWRRVERILPALAMLLAIVLVSAYANVFGYPAEFLIRAGNFTGFIVAACALVILLARRGDQSPTDYQRLRWVIWGCLIGLPSLTLADIGQQTTLLDGLWERSPPPDEFWDLVRLINGILCLFVFEAVRKPVVVSVAIPLRRVTILGLLLSAPALFVHEQYQHISENYHDRLALPGAVWVALATLALFLISRLHEFTTHHADRLFNRGAIRAGDAFGKELLQARDCASIEALLAVDVCKTFRLACAGVFCKDDSGFRGGIRTGDGSKCWPATLAHDDPIIRHAQSKCASDVALHAAAPGDQLTRLEQPVFAVPVANRFELFAVALYGPHASGANLNHDERATLAKLAGLAGDVWARLAHQSLLQRIAVLQGDRDRLATKLAATVIGHATEGQGDPPEEHVGSHKA